MEKEISFGWKWRKGELTFPDYSILPTQEQVKYLIMLGNLNKEELSSTDRYIITYEELSKNNKKKYPKLNYIDFL